MGLTLGKSLPGELRQWLAAHAASLDECGQHSEAVLPQLARHGLPGIGVPRALGGEGGDVRDALQAIAGVAEESLTAAFMLWGQRTFIEYLLQSPNEGLRERWLAALLAGRQAGATGLSNAMKFLSGLEQLQVRAEARAEGWLVHGRLPWVTNLRGGRFIVAAAVAGEGEAPFVVALPCDRAGLRRGTDLDLIALRGSDTAAIDLDSVHVDARDLIHANARQFLPRVRPAFLGLQCGLAIGVARASLAAARAQGGPARSVLSQPIADAEGALQATADALHAGLGDGRFATQAPALFRLRIRLAEIALQAVGLELQASGGRAYQRDQPLGFARRWREAAFVPIVTPSLTQLQGELDRHAPAGRP